MNPQDASNEGASDEMSTTTFADRIALGQVMLEWYQERRAELPKKGIQPDVWIQGIGNGIEGTVHANEVQETLKAQTKAATKDLRRWDGQLYTLESGAIDAAVGAYGKGSPESKQLATFRSKLHRPKAEQGEPPLAAKP